MTSPDTTPVMTNLEGHEEFNVAWPWLNGTLTPGLTTVLRVKNEARSMPRVLPPMLAATDHVVVVDNQSDDGTAEVAVEVAAGLGASQRLTVKEYPFDVSRCGLEHLSTPERSVHSLAYFYNWAFSHVSTTYSMKWDGDMVLTQEGVAILRDVAWQLSGDLMVRMARHPLFVESESVAYLDRGTLNVEPYVYPMASGYAHVKAFEWELRLYPDNVSRMRLPEGVCVELKYLDSDEFSHWTAPDSFADSARNSRKRREWEVFHALVEGGWRELGNVERIEAPPGLHVVDYVTQCWLPRSARPVVTDLAEGEDSTEASATTSALLGDTSAVGTPTSAMSLSSLPPEGDQGEDILESPVRQPTSDLTRSDERRALYVVGPTRSGLGTFAGILQRLGMRVPERAPSGAGERDEDSWEVTFNRRLLRRGLIETCDARPQAWLLATRLSTLPNPRENLVNWLSDRLRDRDELMVTDPRLSWFVGMWRAAAIRAGAVARFATVLRPPTSVIGSQLRHDRRPAGNATRAGAWINLVLLTERATRDSARAFVRYDDLLEDWTKPVHLAGELLGLTPVSQAMTNDIRRVNDFVDPSRRGTQPSWDGLGVPGVLRDLAEETWRQVSRLADPGEDTPSLAASLDALREDYAAVYAESEGIVSSSIQASRPAPPPDDAFLVELEQS